MATNTSVIAVVIVAVVMASAGISAVAVASHEDEAPVHDVSIKYLGTDIISQAMGDTVASELGDGFLCEFTFNFSTMTFVSSDIDRTMSVSQFELDAISVMSQIINADKIIPAITDPSVTLASVYQFECTSK